MRPRWGVLALRKVFEVELSSQDGLCAELTLPAAPYALLDALERLDLADGEAPRWEILRMHSCSHLSPYLEHGGTLSELNALAQRLSELGESELHMIEGLIGMEQSQPGITPVPLPRLIDLAYSTDCCHLVEGVVTDAKLGRFCAENSLAPGADDLSDAVFELLDFAKIGREFRHDEGGVFTRGGYVQRFEKLKQVYKDLDLTLKKPDYAILAELPDGSRVELPAPLGETLADGPAQCVDCAAPALNGLTAMRSTLDLLAFRLAELEVDGELPKYKAVLAATRCDDITQALALADGLDQYAFDPEPRGPDEVAIGHLKGLLPEEELVALLSHVNLYRYGQAVMEQGGGKLTGYGYVQPAIGPVQDMEPQRNGLEMM